MVHLYSFLFISYRYNSFELIVSTLFFFKLNYSYLWYNLTIVVWIGKVAAPHVGYFFSPNIIYYIFQLLRNLISLLMTNKNKFSSKLR